MPKYSTFPFLFDDVLSISTTKLLKWKYIKSGNFKSGTITWSRNGVVTSTISIIVDFKNESPSLRLIYTCNGNPYDYYVYFESTPSNLGFGEVWYFTCPFTRKRCRKLHLINEQFMHRSNLRSGMYGCQTESKKWRAMNKYLSPYFETDRLYQELYSKNFKKYYAGKPTKKYVHIMKQIQKAERIPVHEIERLMLSR
ncbi:hypothetical protein [Ulvibacter antarcticus]|uniref:Uncharacterized protein n=1 Tax=Ulvibacter antarcticus TaxID=442714 RepID=A0A3L9YC17_9FLAO|nr:hypothetical protein [Ulvibacter antarcticus]RMA56649.1 hypothetical protein BXY75_3352 [Ulvibacter antarcticus]